jgi:hypothetical protein
MGGSVVFVLPVPRSPQVRWRGGAAATCTPKGRRSRLTSQVHSGIYTLEGGRAGAQRAAVSEVRSRSPAKGQSRLRRRVNWPFGRLRRVLWSGCDRCAHVIRQSFLNLPSKVNGS